MGQAHMTAPLERMTAGSVPSIGAGITSNTSAAAPIQRITPFAWQGSPWHLAGVCVLNFVLMLLTVGIYGFWGRTEIRRRMWSSVRLMGEPMAYHGTPQELLRGFFAVLAIVLVPLFILGSAVVIIFGQASAIFGLYQIGLFLFLYPVLTAIAFYRARRYRLSRTSWRGVRASMSGSSNRYGLFSWATALAYLPTLGWIGPYRAIALQHRIVGSTALGNRPLLFSGTAKSLYGRYALLWFGTIILYVGTFAIIGTVLGTSFRPDQPQQWLMLTRRDWATMVAALVGSLVIWSLMSSFYYARLYNHIAESTHLPAAGVAAADSPRFDLNVKGWRIIWLFVSNALITYLSLYILKPVATARAMKYYTENLAIVGPFDPASIGQNLAAIDQSGEGLAQAFDLDAF
jgi:uncharacterized membrane protein YjgN (DUF898 family)